MSPPAPVASVIVPVHNGSGTIDAQLDALAAQTFSGPFEVLVVDNGSTDDTVARVSRRADSWPALRVVSAVQKSGAAYARNEGARQAAGEVLAFCDADDVAHPSWLASLVSAAQQAQVVGGSIDSTRLNDALSRRWRPPLPHGSLPVSHGFLPYALGANVAFAREAFAKLGGFREDYPVGEDVELVWRAQLEGMQFVFAADAVVHYRYRRGLRDLIRQYIAYGTIGPRLYRDFRQHGMPPSPLRGAVGPWARLVLRLPVALVSRELRGDVLRRIAFRWGRVRGSFAAHVVYL